MDRADKVIIPILNYPKLVPEDVIRYLEENGFAVEGYKGSEPIAEAQLTEMIADAYGVIAGVERYGGGVIRAAKKLKVIARFGVGTDNIDLQACAAQGVTIARTANHETVAEMALAMMLATLKRFEWYSREIRSGGWGRTTVHELRGKTVGLLGFGRVAQSLAALLSVFHTETIAFDPYFNVEAGKTLGVLPVSLEELLARSDVISLHLPYTEATRHLLNEAAFAAMREGVFIVNTARGPIIEETALIRALQSGRVAGAGLDVYEQEPIDPGNPLLSMRQVVMTPHVGGASIENWGRTSRICAESIVAVREGRAPQYPVKLSWKGSSQGRKERAL